MTGLSFGLEALKDLDLAPSLDPSTGVRFHYTSLQPQGISTKSISQLTKQERDNTAGGDALGTRAAKAVTKQVSRS